MGFRDDMRRFVVKTKGRERRVFDSVVDGTFQSIVYGSEVTGAPGQPIDKGDLINSWMIDQGEDKALVYTDIEYANQIEDGERGGRALNLRSTVGGFHSVKLTVMGFDRLVEQAVQSSKDGE